MDIEEQVKELLDIPAEEYSNMYDDSPDPYADESNYIKIMPGLTPLEKAEAALLYPFSRGLMIVSGPPRSGKTLFANTIVWKMHRYFGKPILLDYKPRQLMGKYIFVDAKFLSSQMDVMTSNALGEIDSRSLLRFQNAAMGLDEFKRYMNKRRPMTKMNEYIGNLIRVMFHLDILIVGITQDANNDLDPRTCLPYVSHDVRCQWCATRKDTAIVQIYPMRFVSSHQVIEVSGKPFQMVLDGGKPRPALNGKRYFDLYASKNITSLYVGKQRIEL